MLPPKEARLKDAVVGLHWAAVTGNLGLVKFTLDHGVSIESTMNGLLPLQTACISDANIAIVQYLIDRGAQVNAQKWSKKHCADKSQTASGAIGATALHVACTNGCTRIVDLLLRNGAKVNIRDQYGVSPLQIAKLKGHTTIVNTLETLQQIQQCMKSSKESDDDDAAARTNWHGIDTAINGSYSASVCIPDDKSCYELSLYLGGPIASSTFTLTPPSSSSDLSLPETSSSESTSMTTMSSSTDGAREEENTKDYYGQGVVFPYHEDNYLTSLERRSYGIEPLLSSPADDSNDVGYVHHKSLPMLPQQLEAMCTITHKRSISDNVQQLRTRALRNMMTNNGKITPLSSGNQKMESLHQRCVNDAHTKFHSRPHTSPNHRRRQSLCDVRRFTPLNALSFSRDTSSDKALSDCDYDATFKIRKRIFIPNWISWSKS
ncbi:ankyrin repeat-containing domain protein [Radiomyces spectabilis]|uniref:ankyrin repeat-containing domain protein n=1 Tax=Radiomyces spectabilis TaxID=64574 RepID=UPI00221FEC09|nr:ankyrin repeat-containing domain protein [Radiomyces spectabilis]KAI8381209.1 ankyrin repeat-containing domain protein [Radiomyces spectabilis]